MAIEFLEQLKRQRYLILVLAIIILMIIIVIWRGFFAIEKPVLPPVEKPVKKIEIDFQTLKSPLLEKFQIFEAIPPFEEEAGRENPFLTY